MSFIARDAAFRRLIDRFELETLEREYPIMLSRIVPVTNIDELKRVVKYDKVGSFSYNGTGKVTFYTIPEGMRYTIIVISLIRTAGDRTLDSLYVGKDNLLLESSTSSTANQNFLYSVNTGRGLSKITLDQNTPLITNVSGGTINSVWDVYMLYEEENAF